MRAQLLKPETIRAPWASGTGAGSFLRVSARSTATNSGRLRTITSGMRPAGLVWRTTSTASGRSSSSPDASGMVSTGTPRRVAARYPSVSLIPFRIGKRSWGSRSRRTAKAPRSRASRSTSSQKATKGSSGRGKRVYGSKEARSNTFSL
jgi:hypothetical protein